MSVAVMGAVFKVALPPSEKVVALAMADHAHDDGTEARMGLDSLALKCTLSRRQIQRVIRSLVEKGIVQIERPSTPSSPAWYRFNLDENGNICFAQGRQIVTPMGGHPGSLGVTPRVIRGDTGVTLTIKNHHEKNRDSKFSFPPPVDISVYEQMREQRSDDGVARARLLRNIALGNLKEPSG